MNHSVMSDEELLALLERTMHDVSECAPDMEFSATASSHRWVASAAAASVLVIGLGAAGVALRARHDAASHVSPVGQTPVDTAATITPTTGASIGTEPSTATTVTSDGGCYLASYVVLDGDTVAGVAQRFNVSVEALKAVNATNPSFAAFPVGSTVFIPLKTPFACTGSPSTPEFAALLNRPWRVVAYGTPGSETPVSPDYTNTLEFLVDGNGNATVSTHGCLVETIQITVNDDKTFVVGARLGPQSACPNPFDEGQHVADALTEGATVRWSIGADARLTLTPVAAIGTVVVYE